MVANPAPGTVEQLDALTKEQLRQVLADADVARGRYTEASRRLGDRRIIGALITMTGEGARLVRIKKGYGAEMAGLQDGDVLVTLNGESLAGNKPDEFIAKLDKVPFGSAATVTFSRSGNQSQAAVVVGVPEDLPTRARQSSAAPATPPAASAPQAATPQASAAPKAPTVEVQKVEVRPNHVAPGSPYDLVVTFVATDPAAGSGVVHIEYSYRVIKNGQVLYTLSTVALDEPNGSVRERTEHLKAVPAVGTYTFQAMVTLKGMSSSASAVLEVAPGK